MTLVNVYLTAPDPKAGGTGERPVKSGEIVCTPTRRRHIDKTPDDPNDRVVLPSHASVKVVDGRAVLDLAPTGPDWCWRFTERYMTGGDDFYAAVPDAAEVAYGDLVRIDPATLDPIVEPEAAWWAAAGEAIEGIGIAEDAAVAAAESAATSAADAGEATVAAQEARDALIESDAFVAGKVEDPVSLTSTALDGKYAPRGGIVARIGQNVAAKLDMEFGQQVIAFAGDSTGNDAFEWIRKLAQHFADRYPFLRLPYTLWSDASKSYPPFTIIQEGTTPSGGPTTTISDNFNRTATDLIGTAGQAGGPWQGTAGRFSLDGSKMLINTPGVAHTYGTQSGDKVTSTAHGVNLNTTPAATVKTLEVATKAIDVSNHVFVTISVNTSGAVTWGIWQRIADAATKLVDGPALGLTPNAVNTFDIAVTVDGLDVTATINGVTATAAIAQATANALAGGNGLIVWPKNAGIAGTAIDSIDLVVDVPLIEGPTLTIYNGSMPGSTLTYQTANFAAMVPERPDLMIISTGHNYNAETPEAFVTAISDFVTLLHSTYPDVPVIASGQNPEFSDGGRAQNLVDAHRDRQAALRVAAIENGWGYIPVYEAFISEPDGGRAWVMADGIHPNYDPSGAHDGSDLWVAQAKAYFDSMSQRTDL